MAILKSFELKGNKLSFANWISNLSPCETPFTSMIGKEGIDQIQYSWQTDSLAPASSEAFEEGSQAIAQPRATTQVLTNFTSILRTVASVSDTVKEMSTYGRNKEMQYQLGKAGKEILRDLEHMSLTNLNGLPGSDSVASTFAGFEGLVAGMNVADADTGAVVHKMVQSTGTRFDKNDLFDITANLYIAGSKADKIMFHPKYAVAFSELITNDLEADLTYRMFDGMDTKFNTQVKKIKDPLGRIYTLIPNRHMPEDKFYIFHESDWTQTVLRSPKTTKLAKKGSSDQYMIEMEVGLRHRHPFASGILALTQVNVHNNFFPARRAYTAAVNDSQDVRSDVTVDGVAEAGLEVSFHSSHPDVIDFANVKVLTDGQGRVSNSMRGTNLTGFSDVWTVCKGVKSQVSRIVSAAPLLDFLVSNETPAKDEVVTLEAVLKKHDGGVVGEGFDIKWYVDPAQNLELTAISSETEAGGLASTTAKILNTNETLVQATFGKFVSSTVILNYVPKPDTIEVSATPNTFETGTSVDGFAMVLDSSGDPLQGVTVAWAVEPQRLASVNPGTSITDSNGLAECKLLGQNKGQGKIKAVTVGSIQVHGEGDIFVGTGAVMDFTINPNPTKVGVDTEFRVELIGRDGVPLSGVDVKIKADMGGELDITGTTDVFGTFSDRVTFTTNSDLEVTATAAGFELSKVQTLTFDDTTASGAPTLEVSVNPTTGNVGNPTTATVVYKDGLGQPIVNSSVRFLTIPTWSDSTLPDMETDDTGTASLNFTATKPGDYKVRAHVTGSNPVVESAAVEMKFT